MDKIAHLPVKGNRFALTTKESLVYLLFEKQSKKAKQLHRHLNRNNKRGISYQAVHKSLLDLVEKTYYALKINCIIRVNKNCNLAEVLRKQIKLQEIKIL